MKKILLAIVFGAAFFVLGSLFSRFMNLTQIQKEAVIIPKIMPKPLEKYAIENLSRADIKPGVFEIGEVIEETGYRTSHLFSFSFDPDLDGKNDKKTTGVINLPKEEGPFPVIIMLRGFVDQKIYQSGMGTKKAGAYFGDRGFITIAPDFLGYAGSDKEAENIFESRFQTYVTVLSLLSSLQSNQLTKLPINQNQIFLWGHSNGGQIALTILEITGKNYPTVLWAPVSKPFPYSILYYTDESEDKGKLIRKELAKFEANYDVEKYSITNYFDKINKDTKIQIHQGTADDAVPFAWTDDLIKELKIKNLSADRQDSKLKINYHVYPGADHNLQPSWNRVVERDLDFFRKYF